MPQHDHSGRDFDDRGVIYIRHGEPTSRATYAAPGLEPNESWRYTRPEGDLLFHFVAREDVQDFKLVESLFDVLGFSEQVALREDRAGQNPMAEQLMLSREQLSPIYTRLQAAGQIGSGQYQAEERQIGQNSIALGTRTDSYQLRFAREQARFRVEFPTGEAGRPPRLVENSSEPRRSSDEHRLRQRAASAIHRGVLSRSWSAHHRRVRSDGDLASPDGQPARGGTSRQRRKAHPGLRGQDR